MKLLNRKPRVDDEVRSLTGKHYFVTDVIKINGEDMLVVEIKGAEVMKSVVVVGCPDIIKSTEIQGVVAQ